MTGDNDSECAESPLQHIEHDYPFKLTVDNVDTLAGKNNPYHKLVRGVGILPSRAMKKKNSDYSD